MPRAAVPMAQAIPIGVPRKKKNLPKKVQKNFLNLKSWPVLCPPKARNHAASTAVAQVNSGLPVC